jgi:MiaB/RimO family radical SAM methylthiotransferase
MKVFTIHNGCETNLYDSEKAKSLMLLGENTFSESREGADVIVFHACTFTQQKEEETKDIVLQLLKTTSKNIVVSGCYLSEYVKDNRISYVKNESLPAHITKLNREEQAKQEQLKKRVALLPFVQISRGCYGNCTFCSIKSVKGSNKSRTIDEILYDIEQRQHHDTIKLVGDEDAGYGRDIGINLKILIEEVVKRFPKLKIKLGSLNAKLLKKYSEDELAILAHENVVGNIHVPIQSASNKILKNMNRGYTIEEYAKIYLTLKHLGVKNISGDIIIGFPSEDEQDHQKNIDFISKNAFSFMEVFVYHERPGTKAAEMEQIDFAVREKRASEILVKYLKSYSRWHNIPYEILVKQTPVFNTNINFKIK